MSSDWDLLDSDISDNAEDKKVDEVVICNNMKQIMNDDQEVETSTSDLRRRPCSPISSGSPSPPNPPRVISVREDDDYGVCSHAISYMWYVILCGLPSCC